MKKIVVAILFISFLIQSFSQLWILTSFHINREDIAKNICINRFDQIPVCKGQCFLEQKLQENEAKNEEQLPEFKQVKIQLFQPNNDRAFESKIEIDYKEIEHDILYQFFIPSRAYHAVFQPPKAVLNIFITYI